MGMATLRVLVDVFVLAITPETVPVTAGIASMNELSVTRTGDATVTPLRSNRIVPPASVTFVAAVSPLPKMRSASSVFTTISSFVTMSSVTHRPSIPHVPEPMSVTRDASYPAADENTSAAPSATSNVIPAGT